MEEAKGKVAWGRKSQVTIFIIMGILIVLIAVVIYLMMDEDNRIGGAFRDALIKDVPYEMMPVQSYIDKCLIDVSEQALVSAGRHGGYTYPEEWGIDARAGAPTESNAVEFPPTGSEVPYWHYMASPNSCLGDCYFSTEFPYLRKSEGTPSIEDELEKYVERNIRQCLANFTEFTEKGWEIRELSEPLVQARVASEEVIFLLFYELDAKNLETTRHTLDTFTVSIPVNLEKIYVQALYLAYLESQRAFLERHTMNIIASFDYKGESRRRLPSISHTEVEFGNSAFWEESMVEEDVKRLLESYVAWLQVNGTLNYVERTHPNARIQSLMVEGMTLPGQPQLDGLEVNFAYYRDFWNRIYFNVCEGGVCQPKTAGITFPVVIGFSLYKFFYDISYPVVVEVRDSSAMNNKGLSFYIGLEANVRDNKPASLNQSNESMNISINSTASELYCNYNQRHSGNITITVKDSYDNPVQGAGIVYTCAENSCALGTTDSSGTINTRFPTCFGGIVSAVKQDYLTVSAPMSTYLNESGDKELVLHNLHSINVSVRGHLSYMDASGNWWPDTAGTYFHPPEDQIMLNLERLSPLGESDYTAMTEVWGTNKSSIRLGPGTYQITAGGVHFDDFVLDTEVCESTLFGDKCVDVYMDLNDSLRIAGLNITHTFRKEDFESGKELVIWVASADPAQITTIEALDVTHRLEDITEAFSSGFTPEWR